MVILDWNNISQYYCIFDQTNANTGSKWRNNSPNIHTTIILRCEHFFIGAFADFLSSSDTHTPSLWLFLLATRYHSTHILLSSFPPFQASTLIRFRY